MYYLVCLILNRKKYLPLLRKAVEQCDARPDNLALLEDRVLVADNKNHFNVGAGIQYRTDLRIESLELILFASFVYQD